MGRGGVLILNLILHFLALGGLAWAFWPYANRALTVLKLPGHDSDQFIHYAYHFSQRFVWPPAGWDHLWYEGVPRVLNMTFFHFYLIQPLVKFLGLNLATKLYPLIWLIIFLLFSYLLFYRLSKSQLIGFALTCALICSQSIYLSIWRNGVVLSGLAQMVFPAVLFFLVLFAQKRDFRYLVLAAVFLALQFYSHGAIGLFFGFVSALIFFIFYRFEKEKWFSWQPIKMLAVFTFITLTVGALAIFPQVLSGLAGGYYSQGALMGRNEPLPNVFQFLWEMTHPALFLGFGLSVLIGIVFYKNLKSKRLILPLLTMLVYFLVFLGSMIWGLNPLSDYLFAARVIWYFALILAALSALLFSGLSGMTKPFRRLFSSLGQLMIVGVVVGLVLIDPLSPDEVIRGEARFLPTKTKQDEWLLDFYQEQIGALWHQVDQQDTNHRAWLEAADKIFWNTISPVPLIQGYFHFYTQYSPTWTAWLYATIAEKAAQMKTLPEEIAEKQALYLIDWYGLKYMVTYPLPEFNVVTRFWQDDQSVASRSASVPPAVLEIKPEFTSGIIEAVNLPVVGFVGKQSGYDAFLRDLALLNLNTRSLVPLRLAKSIEKVPQRALEAVDLLILYNFEGKNWDKIADYVQKGGKVWIETGGESSFKEGEFLPSVFPSRELKFGSLGQTWQVEKGDELTQIDFEKLSPLVYRGEAWKVWYVPSEPLERGRVLLSQAGKPIITEHQLGQGKVLWSGANLWYRPMEYLRENSLREVEVLRVLLARLIPLSQREPVKISLQREKSEKIMVAGEGFGGVILKENFLPGWKAKANGKKLAVFPAGLDFMYFPLSDDLKGKPVQVEIIYQGPLIYWFLFFFSIFSLILASEEIISHGWLGRKIETAAADSIKTIKGWWEKEEEYG